MLLPKHTGCRKSTKSDVKYTEREKGPRNHGDNQIYHKYILAFINVNSTIVFIFIAISLTIKDKQEIVIRLIIHL